MIHEGWGLEKGGVSRSLVGLSLATLLFAGSASAQSVVTYARVVRHAVVLEQPRGDSPVLTTIPPGVVVELVALRGDWYQTSLKFDADTLARPFGWIQRQTVELLPAQAQEQLSTAREVPLQQPRAARFGDPRTRARQYGSGPPLRPSPVRDCLRFVTGFGLTRGMGYGSAGCDGCLYSRATDLAVGYHSAAQSARECSSAWAQRLVWIWNWEAMGTLDARLRFYPSLTSGFFITGGLGLGHVSDGYDTVWGPGAVVGLGWDVRVGRNVSLTPFWNGFAMSSEFVDRNVGQLGLGVTIH